MIELYYSPSYKKYLTTEEVFCSECGDEINKIAFIHSIWNKKGSIIKTLCDKHFPQKLKGVIDEVKYVLIVSEIPKDAFLVFLRPPEFKEGKVVSVFEAADPKFDKFIGGEEGQYSVTNRCKLSGTPEASWEGSQIGCSDKVKELDSRFSEPTDLLLENIKSSEILLPGAEKLEIDSDSKDKEQIEDKSK